MDFSKLGTSSNKKAPLEPIKIFESLPSLDGTPNDLWRGQAEALEGWNSNRDEDDILVSLNTGAGKTIVGLLIAQSLVNEGLNNVIYVCSTIDLVYQTSLEAEKIGLDHTTRTEGGFSNKFFETGKSFCITTYHAIFNGHSVLRKKYFPSAIIFDDAHVAESILRDAFTLRISSKKHTKLFNDIANLFEPHFSELQMSSRFRDSLSRGEFSSAFVAPRGLYQRAQQLQQLFEQYKLKESDDLKYAYQHIRDNILSCAAIFHHGEFELTPPFLPSLSLDIFENKVRRVYLSASLQSKVEFIKAFGRKPSQIIEPLNDAGNGERLIVFGDDIENAFSKDYVKNLSQKTKIVIAVPSYYHAEKWKDISIPPERNRFTDDLNEFRESSTGAFTLVSRVDGIDLPHDTCRLMLMEGLPAGASLLELFQWRNLRMTNVYATKIANKIVQLFGRINRGRKDYGVFLIEGKELCYWLGNDRNVSLLPSLLQKQILLGRNVQTGMKVTNLDKVNELTNEVLSRNESWLKYYENEVKLGELDDEQIRRTNMSEPILAKAAEIEAKYAYYVWNRDYCTARLEIEKDIDTLSKADTPLSGWHYVWLAAAFDLEGDIASADRAYHLARKRLGSSINLPINTKLFESETKEQPNSFAIALLDHVPLTSNEKAIKLFEKLKSHLDLLDQGESESAEYSMRLLGEILGFESLRPDNDQKIGPDVLWVDELNNLLISFELKTEKLPSTPLYKKDIGQGHNHLEWVNQNYEGYNNLGLIYISNSFEVANDSSPSHDMGFCSLSHVVDFKNQFSALLDDTFKLTPIERKPFIYQISTQQRWSITTIVKQLWEKDLLEK